MKTLALCVLSWISGFLACRIVSRRKSPAELCRIHGHVAAGSGRAFSRRYGICQRCGQVGAVQSG